MKVKKFLSAILATVFLSSVASTFPANAEDNETLCCPCGLVETDDYSDLDFYEGDNVRPITYAVLPSSVDLSETVYFPEIGDQGGLGACVAFATTYYQYSYEVNRLNGITSESQRVVYSPKWTYNILNGGTTDSVSMQNVYSLLRNFGCLKLEDLPYDGVDYTTIPGGMEAEKIEALETRLESFGTLSLPSSGTFITSSTDSNLTGIKTALNDGKVLMISTLMNFNIKNGYGTYSNQEIAYRCYRIGDELGHGMVVVGYDDNITCDVNGNGSIEECEKGAFKVANSWGTDYKNDGFIWVLYDAINLVSANTVNNWEASLSGSRRQALSNSSAPEFRYINVTHKDVYLIGEADITTQYFNNLRIGRAMNSAEIFLTTYEFLQPFDTMIKFKDELHPFDGVLLFDYSDLCSPINYYLSGYNCHANITTSSYKPVTSKFRVIDNKCRVLADYEADDSEFALYEDKCKPINTKLGDIDYDGVLSQNDSSLVQQYLVRSYSLSTLQKVLADYNQDGNINVADSTAILANKEV